MYVASKEYNRGMRNECTNAGSAPNRCLKGFIIVAPNAAAGAPCHAGILVTARGRVRSCGCGSLVSVVGNGIETVVVLGKAEA